MATAKKKPVTRKKTTATHKKAATTSAHYKTLHAQKAAVPFLSFKITKQTFYWVVLVAFIVLVEVIILDVQANEIQATNLLITQQNN